MMTMRVVGRRVHSKAAHDLRRIINEDRDGRSRRTSRHDPLSDADSDGVRSR
jgi:hypothetical protein